MANNLTCGCGGLVEIRVNTVSRVVNLDAGIAKEQPVGYYARCNQCGITIQTFNSESEAISAKWTYQAYEDVYKTDCGELFCLNDGTPDVNGMHYCHYCGKLIQEITLPESEG